MMTSAIRLQISSLLTFSIDRALQLVKTLVYFCSCIGSSHETITSCSLCKKY